MLADLVLVTAPSGVSRDEQERVDTEIREDLTIRTWIDQVAHELRNELAARVSAKGARVAIREEIQGDESVDEEAEMEASPRAAFRQA